MKSTEMNGVISARKYNKMVTLYNKLRERNINQLAPYEVSFCIAFKCNSDNLESIYEKIKQPAGGEGEW